MFALSSNHVSSVSLPQKEIEPFPFCSLPDTVQLHILNFSQQRERKNYNLVNRLFHSLLLSNPKELTLKHPFFQISTTPKQIETLLDKAPNIYQLTVDKYFMYSFFAHAFQKFPLNPNYPLRSFTCDPSYCFSAKKLKILATCKNLEKVSLALKSQEKTYRALTDLLALKILKIESNSALKLVEELHPLKNLQQLILKKGIELKEGQTLNREFASLRLLKILPDTEYVSRSIASSGINAGNISFLSRMPNLTHLTLTYDRQKANDSQAQERESAVIHESLSALKQLQFLSLSRFPVKGKATFLKNFKHLHTLVTKNSSAAPFLPYLKDLPQLKQLKLSGVFDEEVLDLEGLKQLNHLEKLTLSDWDSPVSHERQQELTDAISHLTELRQLKLTYYINEIALLKNLPHLQSLYLVNDDRLLEEGVAPPQPDFSFFAEFTALKSLHVIYPSQELLVAIEKCPALTELTLGEMNHSLLPSLARFTQLKKLHIGFHAPLNSLNTVVNGWGVDFTGWQLDDSKEEVEEEIEDSKYKSLNALIQLEELSLNQVADEEGFSDLEGLTSLKILRINVRKVSEKGLAKIERLISLSHLKEVHLAGDLMLVNHFKDRFPDKVQHWDLQKTQIKFAAKNWMRQYARC